MIIIVVTIIVLRITIVLKATMITAVIIIVQPYASILQALLWSCCELFVSSLEKRNTTGLLEVLPARRQPH